MGGAVEISTAVVCPEAGPGDLARVHDEVFVYTHRSQVRRLKRGRFPLIEVEARAQLPTVPEGAAPAVGRCGCQFPVVAE